MTKSELDDLCSDMEDLISDLQEAAEEGDLKAIREILAAWEEAAAAEEGS